MRCAAWRRASLALVGLKLATTPARGIPLVIDEPKPEHELNAALPGVSQKSLAEDTLARRQLVEQSLQSHAQTRSRWKGAAVEASGVSAETLSSAANAHSWQVVCDAISHPERASCVSPRANRSRRSSCRDYALGAASDDSHSRPERLVSGRHFKRTLSAEAKAAPSPASRWKGATASLQASLSTATNWKTLCSAIGVANGGGARSSCIGPRAAAVGALEE